MLRDANGRLVAAAVREQEARADAEEANRLKDEFLATLSHELRTPLTAILGWARLLRSGRLDERSGARALEIIERNADAQNQLIEDILDVSRIITGKLALHVEPVEPVAVIEAAVEAVRPAAEAKRVELNIMVSPEMGLVSGDAARLRQVVWNLLTNAVKFTPEGGRVEVRVERADSHVRIKVSDTGEGIDPEFLPYVFDRFRQADASTTRKRGGLGLGLAIVRYLVELHAGTMSAESEGLGRGAIFTVILPLADTQSGGPEGSRGAREESIPAPADNPQSLAGLRVLVVDDEPDTLDFIVTVLEGRGAEVTAASTAAEAFRMMREVKPDVLVSDIGMPNEDGYALIREVRRLEDAEGGRTPAVALTAYAREADRREAIRAGFQTHMTKPVEPSELAEVIASLAGRVGRV
jgi:CheY-like chemotaxis protein